MTYREQFDSAMKCKTKEEAVVWLENEIKRYEADYGKTRDEATAIILANLGYMAGYYDQATSQKIFDLFGARHPIFGKPDYWSRVSAGQALMAGLTQSSEPKGV